MPQTLKRNDVERIHVQVAHQERNQLRKSIRLLRAHKSGAHKENQIITCASCTVSNFPVSNNVRRALPKFDEVTKNA